MVMEKINFNFNLVLMGMGIVMAYLVSVALAKAGTATFYTEYIPSACYGNESSGEMIAAAGKELWNNGSVCGQVFKVRCTGPWDTETPFECNNNTVEVKVVDYCPGCFTTLGLSKEAFGLIAQEPLGVIKIEYIKI